MAVLTTTITEEVYLNGANRGSTNTVTISGINDVMHRIVDVQPSVLGYVDLISFGATAGGSFFVANDTKYIRVTNIDKSSAPASTYLKVQTANNEHVVVLDVNESYVLFNDNIYAGTGVDQIFSLADVKTLKAGATGASNCPVEIFVASA